MAEYSPEARPERHPGIATFLPTRLPALAMAATAILMAMAVVIALGAYAPAIDAVERAAGSRFEPTMAALRACVDPRSGFSLAGWCSQMLLVGAALVALVVRHMRRHRRDDYRGRYRAWGWLAGLLFLAACSAQVPLGRLVGILVADATGVAFGPGGFGWWVSISAAVLVGVSLWAVLPLHERLATMLWLAAGLAAWAGSTACVWVGGGREAVAIAAQATWALGCAAIAIATLAAARSVIREVRGEVVAAATHGKQAEKAAGASRQGNASVARQPLDARDDETELPVAFDADESGRVDYTDGSDAEDERDTRHLSKAERKRLRKLARMNRVA